MVRPQRRRSRFVALVLGLSLVAAACGGDDDDDEGAGGDGGGEAAEEGVQGGELVDLGTFVGDPPEHIDPALNVTLDANQVVDSLYDGLTEVDESDPENPQAVGQVAESWESNDDATVWTFQIREGLAFSDGTPVLPSSFVRAWERATEPDFAGDYSYLFGFIDGGDEKLEGTADEISGVVADDDAMTLEVTMNEAYANFPYVAGFEPFAPMPEAVEELSNQSEWENGLMVGNGPFMLEEARTDEEIVLVPNPEWDGSVYDEALGLPEQPFLDRIRFRVSADPDTAYNSFEAGEGDTALIPPGRVQEADDNYETTLDVPALASYHFEINWEDPVVGGEENVLLRQAISQAINRDEINDAVYDGSRTTATGITPRGIPGFAEDLCEYCTYDPEAAEAAFQAWQDEGNELTEPLRVQFNAGAGHEPVVQIMIDNLGEIGIEAEEEPFDTETYFSQLAEGACQVCRSGWNADYPTYDNFMYDLFHTDAIGGNNHGAYSVPEFDQLVDEAKTILDPEEQAEMFQEAERVLLNDTIGVIPVNWYLGDYVYNGEKIANFPQSNQQRITWEMVSLRE
jgi:oligopeptide transport system substrate-binding protein